VELLLDGGEEAVEVDVEEGEAVGMGGGGHGVSDAEDYIRFLFAATIYPCGISVVVVRIFSANLQSAGSWHDATWGDAPG
jgi:hypothetical protein